MARGVNKVILVGNLGQDPEIKYTQSGACVVRISVATSESWKDKDGNQQERTEWHRCKAFGRLAEIMGEYLKKGRQVYIEGSLRTEKYTDKNGVEKFSTDVVVDEMQMLGGNPGGDRDERPQQQAPQRQQRPPAQQPQRGGGDYGQRSGGQQRQDPPRNDDPFPDDDIPF